MNISELENELDDFLAKEDALENRGIDDNWTEAAEQLQKQLSEQFDSVNKESVIRILSKSLSAFNKLLTHSTTLNDVKFERAANNRINDYHHWQVINDALPQSIRSDNAREAAEIRHETTKKRREEVVAFWLSHIYPNKPRLSNDKAGEWLKDTFTELSIRKLSEYVAEAKKEMKKLPPAGKP